MANDGLVNMVNMANLWKPPFVRFMKCGMPKSPWGFKKHFNGHPWRLDVWGYPHFRFHLHLFWKSIPSGKRLHNYGKSPFLLGKLTISMAMFNSYVTKYQRVIVWKCLCIVSLDEHCQWWGVKNHPKQPKWSPPGRLLMVIQPFCPMILSPNG